MVFFFFFDGGEKKLCSAFEQTHLPTWLEKMQFVCMLESKVKGEKNRK